LGSEGAEGEDGGFELAAEGRQLVGFAAGGRGEFHLGDEALVRHRAEAGGEEIGGDAGEAVEEVAIAAGAEEEVADEEERPAFADEGEGFGDAAELMVRFQAGRLGIIRFTF